MWIVLSTILRQKNNKYVVYNCPELLFYQRKNDLHEIINNIDRKTHHYINTRIKINTKRETINEK